MRGNYIRNFAAASQAKFLYTLLCDTLCKTVHPPTYHTHPFNKRKRAPLSNESTGDQPRPNDGEPFVHDELS